MASPNKSRKKRGPSDIEYVVIGAIVIAVLLVVLVAIKIAQRPQTPAEAETDAAETLSSEVIRINALVDLSAVLPEGTAREIDVSGMTPSEISQAISSMYSWSLAVVNEDADVGAAVVQTVDASATTEAATMGDEDHPDGQDSIETQPAEELVVSASIEVPDLIAQAIPDLIASIVADNEDYLADLAASAETATETQTRGGLFKKETQAESEAETLHPSVYTLILPDPSEQIEEIASQAQTLWYKEATGGSIGSYDASTDTFLMESASSGYEVDKDELIELLGEAIAQRDYTRSIPVPGHKVSAESNITVGDYQILASYSTTTTSNSVRNNNIRLACEALNGTIVRPGEEFSFNNTVGQRTEAKGYGEAAAYNNGEVVQEIGGGVCQVSTTLYNAVLKAGLKITARQSHTFQPTYVTPGLDATVSWGGPDFKFANIPADYDYSYSQSYAIGIRASYSSQKVTVSIYGRPVLKSGYTYSLSSTKTKDLDLVRELITPDSDKEPATGTQGSVWETRLVIKKDGETVSNNVDHMAYYTGHTEYYYEEVPTEPETESESETDEIISDVPLGPGSSTSPTSGVIYGPGTVIMPTQTEEATTQAPQESETTDWGVYISENGPVAIP